MADITPRIPAGRKLIQSYGNGGFRISGETVEGSVIVLPDALHAWQVARPEEITAEGFAPVAAAAEEVEVLLIGTGRSMTLLAPHLRAHLKEHGIVAETMDTGAACRTFNVLLSEDRRVAAALIAVA